MFIVLGDHDIPRNDETFFRAFEWRMLERNGKRYEVESEPCCDFYVQTKESLDLVGLNPSYHQKGFHFSNKGTQLAFLEECLVKSGCGSEKFIEFSSSKSKGIGRHVSFVRAGKL